jgi:hypothetical protein
MGEIKWSQMYLFPLYYYFISHHSIFSPPSEQYRRNSGGLLYFGHCLNRISSFSMSRWLRLAFPPPPSVSCSGDQTLIVSFPVFCYHRPLHQYSLSLSLFLSLLDFYFTPLFFLHLFVPTCVLNYPILWIGGFLIFYIGSNLCKEK